MSEHFITDHGERVPYETVETVNTYENCIFSIKTEVKDKKKKHTFSMESEAIECIKEFIKHTLEWSFNYDIVFDDTMCKFFVNTTNMKALIGNIIPTKCFSIQFTEKYVFHFDAQSNHLPH